MPADSPPRAPSADASDLGIDHLRELVDQVPEGVLVWDASASENPLDMRVCFVSRSASQLLGASPASLVGLRLGDTAPNPAGTASALDLARRSEGDIVALGEILYEPPGRAPRLFRSIAIGLPGARVAVRFEDVTSEREEEAARIEGLHRLIALGEAERRALAIRLQDEVQQQLTAATLLIEGVLRRNDTGRDADRLRSAVGAARDGLAELQRLQFHLSPPEPAEAGLEAAVRTAVDVLVGEARRDVSIDVDLTREPPVEVRDAGLRLISEALTTVQRDAEADRLSVQVYGTDDGLTITVEDDGAGLLPAIPGLQDASGGLAQRAAAHGGTCSIHPATGGGTILRASLPFQP